MMMSNYLYRRKNVCNVMLIINNVLMTNFKYMELYHDRKWTIRSGKGEIQE